MEAGNAKEKHSLGSVVEPPNPKKYAQKSWIISTARGGNKKH